MAYTLADITTKVQQRVRDTSYPSDEITNYINDTINDVYNEYRLPFGRSQTTYTMTAGESDIAYGSGMPTDFVQAIDVVLTTNGLEKVLEYIDKAELERLYPDIRGQNTNVPQYWYLDDDTTIRTFPSPAAAYTVKLTYYKRPTALSTSTSQPALPQEFEELIVVGAAYRVLQVKDNYDQAGVLENKYNELLQKLVVRYSVPQTGRPMRIGINRYGLGKTHF